MTHRPCHTRSAKTRAWAAAIGLAHIALPMAQTVYKVTDENGNVTYTDTPPSDQRHSVETQTIPAANAALSIESSNTGTVALDEAPEVDYQTRIQAPAEGATIPMGPGNFIVEASVAPSLDASEHLLLLLDGAPVGPPKKYASWALTNVFRGEHRLQVQRLDEAGVVLDTSAATTVYVMRPTVPR